MIGSKCTCGKTIPANGCCQAIISNNRSAETAEELMRSRYTAFTQSNGDYLMLSHHSKTRPTKDKNNIVAWAKSVVWSGLSIIRTENGKPQDNNGLVEFRAMYLEKGQLQCIHEVSLFEREENRWVYVSGNHK